MKPPQLSVLIVLILSCIGLSCSSKRRLNQDIPIEIQRALQRISLVSASSKTNEEILKTLGFDAGEKILDGASDVFADSTIYDLDTSKFYLEILWGEIKETEPVIRRNLVRVAMHRTKKNPASSEDLTNELEFVFPYWESGRIISVP